MTKKTASVPEHFLRVANVFHGRLQAWITNAQMQQVASELSLSQLSDQEMSQIRIIVSSMREDLLNRLCDQLGRGRDVEPRAREIAAAFASAGCTSTRQAVVDLQKKMRTKYGERWATSNEGLIRVRASKAEKELLHALQGVFDTDATAVFQLLLRTFVVSAATQKIDFTESPARALMLNDDDLRSYARSLTFKAPLKRSRNS